MNSGFYVLLFFTSVAAIFLLVSHLIYQYRLLKSKLQESEQRRKSSTEFLNLFCRSLATVTEIDHTMQLVAHYFAEAINCESLAIFTVCNDRPGVTKKLRGNAVSGIFPPFHDVPDIVMAKAKYLLEHLRHHYIDFGEGLVGNIAQTRQGILIEDVSFYTGPWTIPSRVKTLMAIPLMVDNNLIGVVCAVNRKEDDMPFFTSADYELFQAISYQAALASNLVNIYADRSEQQRILQELKLGREIQKSLLPSKVPEWGDYKIAAHSGPALEVAGDYYDVVPIDENRLMFIVADATGKGVPACMLMAMCRSFVRSLLEHYEGMEIFLEELNHRLYNDTDKAHFLTMAVAVFDKLNHVCEYGSAGHTPLLVRFSDGSTRAVCPKGPALGLLPNEIGIHFDTFSFSFQQGTSLCMYTDGFNEAVNSEGEEYGTERLEKLWAENNLPPDEMVDMILNEVQNFAAECPQEDDQTMAIICR